MADEKMREGTEESPIIINAKDGDVAKQIQDYVDSHPDHEDDLHFIVHEDDDTTEQDG